MRTVFCEIALLGKRYESMLFTFWFKKVFLTERIMGT